MLRISFSWNETCNLDLMFEKLGVSLKVTDLCVDLSGEIKSSIVPTGQQFSSFLIYTSFLQSNKNK